MGDAKVRWIVRPLSFKCVTGRPAHKAGMEELHDNIRAGTYVVEYLKKLTQSNRRQR